MTLDEFLRELRALLERIVTQARHYGLSERDQRLLSEAWREVERPFDQLQGEVRSGMHDAELERHGLTGSQLELKLEPFRRVLRILERQPEPPRGLFGRVRRFASRFIARLRGPIFWLRKALEKADIVLGSLAEVVQVGGAVKEFKEAVESLLGDLEDGSAGAMAAVE